MKNKRKYYRKCGICGERHEQSEMIRTNNSPNGWVCLDCCNMEFPEYDTNEYWKAVANHVLQRARRLIEYYESEVE